MTAHGVANSLSGVRDAGGVRTRRTMMTVVLPGSDRNRWRRSGHAVLALMSAVVLAPACTSGRASVVAPPCSAETGPVAASVRVRSVAVGAAPFGVVLSASSAVVATGTGLVVMDRSGRTATPFGEQAHGALFGLALSPDGRVLAAATGSGVALVDPATGRVVDRLMAPNERGTIEVAISGDSRLVAASEESSALVTVFDLKTRSLVTQVHVAPVPVGVAFTPDGAGLLVTSEQAGPGAVVGNDRPGVLQVIDTRTWVVRRSAAAGCAPVRVAVSPTGRAWVTARGSNAVEEFDTKKLEAGVGGALVGWTRVGPAPVGVAVADGGRQVVVANSNRFVAGSTRSTLTVVNASGRDGRPAVVGTAVTDGFPRDVASSPDGRTVAASCFGSGTVDVVTLPA